MSKIQEFREFLQGIVTFCNPVSPTKWWPMAGAFARCPGWMPSMLLVALLGATMFLNALIGRWFNGPFVEVLSVATWLTWGLVSCLAMFIGSYDSVKNVRRLGINALLRPRLWFETGRLAWHGAFLVFVIGAICCYIAATLNLNAVEGLVWTFGKEVVEFCIGVFATTGFVGYALSLARWKKPSGRAFECVNFFLSLAAGGGLVVYASDRWPAPVFWPDGIGILAVGAIGLAVLTIGFLLSVYGMERFEARSGGV